MEIDKTVRKLSNFLKTFEKNESCCLREIVARNTITKERMEKLIDGLHSKELFIDRTDDELRSLHFLFVLNTDAGITEELENNSDVGHIIGAIPTLSAYVYLMLSIEFFLVKYLKEVIEFCPLPIVIPILNVVNSNFNYLSSSDYFDLLGNVLSGLFIRIRRTDGVTIPRSLYDTVEMFLLLYKEDETATDFDSRVSSGYKWFSLLRLVRVTSRIRFSANWKVEPIALYGIETTKEPKDDEIDKIEANNEFYEKIFYKCRAFADILDTNVFMAWHEVEFDEMTLQNIIGIEAYKLRAVLDKYKKSGKLPKISSELSDILKSVQKIPDNNVSVKEEKLDKDEIEERIIKSSDFDAKFIADVQTFLQNDQNVGLSYEVSKTFIRKLCSSNIQGVKEEMIRDLIWMLLRRMEFDQISSFAGEFIENCGPYNILYKNSVDLSAQIELMNATNIEDEETNMKVMKEIIFSVFSSAPHVLAVLVKEGCAEEDKRTKIVNLFSTLKSVCHYSFEDSSSSKGPLLMDAVQNFFGNDFLELDITNRHNFFELVCELCHKNLIQENTFLYNCLLNSLNVRENANWQILSEILVFIKKFVNDCREKLDLNLRKILLPVLRVVESARWNIITFTPERMKVSEEGIDVLESIRKLFPTSELSTEIGGIFENGSYRFSALTRVYFIDIYPSFFDEIEGVEACLIALIREPPRHGVDGFLREYEQNESIFIRHIGELLPRLTSKELTNMVAHYGAGDITNLLFILDLISNGISFIGLCCARYSAMSQANSSTIVSCYGQSLNNFLVVLQANSRIFFDTDHKFYFVKHVNRLAAALREFPSQSVQPYQFNLIKFVDDLLVQLKSLNSGSEMTDSMIEEFDRNVRQLFVGFTLL